MELKNCPFCGSSAAFISKSETYGHGDFGVEWFVACVAKSCGAKVPSNDAYHQGEAEQKASAAASWNKRSEYVPQAAPTDLKGALLAICKAVGDHQDSMTPDGSLHLPFVNAVAVLQAHSEPPPSIKNATSHTLFISNESKERE